MTRVAIYSDLHLEFEDWAPPALDVDLVVLAGDIHTGTQGVLWAKRAFSAPVIYVPGNHEFYGHELDRLPAELRLAAGDSHVHVLDGERIECAGLTVAGVTLWTDFDGENPAVLDMSRRAMADYELITLADHDRRALPGDMLALHHRGREWLAGLPPCDIVITHHAPSHRSVSPRFQGHFLNGAFASDLDSLILAMTPSLWVHGHMHDARDYEVGGTRVVCNPRGYPREQGAFDEVLVIDIPSVGGGE